MLDTTTFVGLDVHARSIKAVSLDVMTGEVRAATFGYDAGAVAAWVRSVDPKAKCVYESGVTGFDLQKRLSGLGVDCAVGAVVSVNILFTIFTNVFSPIAPTRMRRIRQRGCAAFGV